jgi:hypothetical protein
MKSLPTISDRCLRNADPAVLAPLRSGVAGENTLKTTTQIHDGNVFPKNQPIFNGLLVSR